MDYKTLIGKPYNYYAFGMAVSEVELDVLTGDHQVGRRVFFW